MKRWLNSKRSWETQDFYPAILNLKGRKCLVVGAGSVGQEKIAGLLETHASVRVVAPEVSDAVREWAEKGMIDLELRPYQESDLDGCFLVIAATEDMDTNTTVSEQAEGRGMLCNVVDVPELCNFILPSIHRNDDLMIAVSTGGASPALARKLRLEIAQIYGDEYAVALKVLGSLREELKGRYPDPKDRKILFERIAYSDLLDWIRNGEADRIEAWIERCIEEGPGYVNEDEHRTHIEAWLDREAVKVKKS